MMMISAGAEKPHPSRAILLRFTSRRPTRPREARARPIGVEMLVMITLLVRGHRAAVPGPGALRQTRPPGIGGQTHRPPVPLLSALLAWDWAAAMAADGE